jgi:hypothetical protein
LEKENDMSLKVPSATSVPTPPSFDAALEEMSDFLGAPSPGYTFTPVDPKYKEELVKLFHERTSAK